MSIEVKFEQAARLPAPGDNAAIAIRRLEAGTRIAQNGRTITLAHTVLEGHRFAIVPVAVGEAVTSWGLPFGLATRAIAPGDYLCNDSIIETLHGRHVDFPLPARGNFKNHFVSYAPDERTFKPGMQVARHAETRCFEGYSRNARRGVGTRNFIVILGTTSLTSGFARALAARFKAAPEQYPNIDGVVAVTHTEGGTPYRPNNYDVVLRTLAGFMVNPNVGAVLAVDFGTEVINNARLREYLMEHDYPTESLIHGFMSVQGDYQSALAQGEATVKSWLERVNASKRTPQSLAHLKIGLQCGGSDAFSGVSGNPLVGLLSKELVRHGGSASLAETDELMGAEPYVLANVRDFATAQAFMRTLKRFQDYASWHGTSAEGNPSGGNMFRGLYNIAIKSIGAARKKDPETRLDYVINYGDLMPEPGFYFMDSPGNDLESIAGQIASGCNMIVFTTGNGSITNFPYVPTIKVMTNSGRFKMLTKEMDFNAGRYLDGEPMEALGRELFEYTVKIAGGERSVGEKAGHSQTQIWRDWRQSDDRNLKQLREVAPPGGVPLKVKAEVGIKLEAVTPSPQPSPPVGARGFALGGYHALGKFAAFETENGVALDQVGLIVPTSLCSGQIARLITDKLNQQNTAASGITRYVALPHTEGCGYGGIGVVEIFLRTMTGYLCHPSVKRCLLLEHGCERTHNDTMRNFLADQKIDAGRFGWASVQLDGGIDNVTAKVVKWFEESLKAAKTTTAREAGLESLRVGLMVPKAAPENVASAFARVAGTIVNAGGLVVVPQNSALLKSRFVEDLLVSPQWEPTLDYGEPARRNGLHIMATPTDHPVETTTGLGATGVEIMLGYVTDAPLQNHPMIPMAQAGPRAAGPLHNDLDLQIDANEPAEDVANELLQLVIRVAAREQTPKLFSQGNTEFQLTRGMFGVTL